MSPVTFWGYAEGNGRGDLSLKSTGEWKLWPKSLEPDSSRRGLLPVADSIYATILWEKKEVEGGTLCESWVPEE